MSTCRHVLISSYFCCLSLLYSTEFSAQKQEIAGMKVIIVQTTQDLSESAAADIQDMRDKLTKSIGIVTLYLIVQMFLFFL